MILPPDADYFAFICNNDPKTIQDQVDLDKEEGVFWARVFNHLINYNYQLDYSSLDACKEKFDLGCRLITVLTEKVDVPKEYLKPLIKKALYGTKAIELMGKVEKLLDLAEKAKNDGAFIICERLLIKVEKGITELEENDVFRLEIDEAFKDSLNLIKFRYSSIDQGLDFSIQVDEEGKAYKRRNNEKKDDDFSWLVSENDSVLSENLVAFDREKVGYVAENKREPIHDAAQNNQSSLISDLFEFFPETLDKRDSDGMTPLMLACANQAFDAACKLLELKANRYEKDYLGQNALIHLMKVANELSAEESAKQDELFNKLIDSNDQIFDYDFFNRSALHWAITNGKDKYALRLIDCINEQTLIDEKVRIAFIEDILFLSAHKEKINIVEYLLNTKNFINIKSTDIREKLFRKAYVNQNSTIIYALIKAGTDICEILKKVLQEKDIGETKRVFKQVISTFRNNTDRTPLMIACDNNDASTVYMLINLDVDSGQRDQFGCNALSRLMKDQTILDEEGIAKHKMIFEQLSFFKDRILDVDLEGKNALHWAIIFKKEDYAIDLINTIKVDQIKDIESILALACEHNLVNLVELLLERAREFKFKVKNFSGILLEFAYINKNPNVIYSLMKAKVNLFLKLSELLPSESHVAIQEVFNEMITEYKNHSGMTLLMIACAKNDIKMALKLIELRASIDQIDDNGQHALFHFLKRPVEVHVHDESLKNDQLFEMLTFVQDLFRPDSEGKSVLDWAIITHKEKYVWELINLINESSPKAVLESALRFGYDNQFAHRVKEIFNKNGLIHLYNEMELDILKTELGNGVAQVKELIRSGADIGLLFNDLCQNNDFQTLEFLIKENLNPIHWILNTCCGLEERNPHLFELAEKLIDKTDLNVRGIGRCSFIHAAVMAKHVNLIKILLHLGADVNDSDNDFSATPLALANDLSPCPEKEEIIKILSNKISSQNVINLDDDVIIIE